jgi:hypothetical protein
MTGVKFSPLPGNARTLDICTEDDDRCVCELLQRGLMGVSFSQPPSESEAESTVADVAVAVDMETRDDDPGFCGIMGVEFAYLGR